MSAELSVLGQRKAVSLLPNLISSFRWHATRLDWLEYVASCCCWPNAALYRYLCICMLVFVCMYITFCICFMWLAMLTFTFALILKFLIQKILFQFQWICDLLWNSVFNERFAVALVAKRTRVASFDIPFGIYEVFVAFFVFCCSCNFISNLFNLTNSLISAWRWATLAICWKIHIQTARQIKND